MKLIITIILFTVIPYVPEKPTKRKQVVTHAPTGKVIIFDRKEVDDRGFAKIFLNGSHVLTCWDENLR